MDEITLKDESLQTALFEEPCSPLSSKRPRIDWASNHSQKKFEFSETFQKNAVSLLSINTQRKSTGQVCPADCGDIKDGKPHNYEETKLKVSPVTTLATSHADDACDTLSKTGFILTERCLLLVLKDEQPLVSECDKLSLHLLDNAGGALGESHTSQDASVNTFSHPDCNRLGESLEDMPPGGCNLPNGNGQDGRQVQNKFSQVQVFTHSSSDEEVRWQSCSTDEKTSNDTGFCTTWSQSAEVGDSNQKLCKYVLSESILLGKGTEEANTTLSDADYAGPKSFHSNSEVDPSGGLAEGVKNEEEKLELQICENEDVAVCETKDQFNENCLRKNGSHCSAECAEGSARNFAIEKGIRKADVFIRAKGEHAAGEMIAKARCDPCDHTAETPMPARISQEPAEGDNDEGPFSVIDPAIWSETDREAGGTHCNSESDTGAELSPSLNVCEMEKPPPPCSDVRPSQEVSVPDQTRPINQQSRAQQCKDEKENVCQSCTAPQACSITTNTTHNKTANEGSALWKSNPSSSLKLLPAEDGRQESLEAVEQQLKEQDQSGCSAVGPKHQEVEHLQNEIARVAGEAEMKQRGKISSDEHRKSQNSMNSTENENHEAATNITTYDCIHGSPAGDLNNKLTHIDEGTHHECLSDHAYSAVIPVEGMTEEKRGKGEAVVGRETEGKSQILVVSDHGQQQQSPKKQELTEASPRDCISKWADMSNSANKSTAVGQHEQANKVSYLSDYQSKEETFMVENNHDPVASTLPATSEAVVPGPLELTPSQNASGNPAALNCSTRFSPGPSAFSFHGHLLGGYDTFTRLQLSLDDDGNDDGSLSKSPLLTSITTQRLKTPQLCQSTPEVKSANEHAVVPEEEEDEREVERLQCHTENMAKGFGFLSSDYICGEVPTSAADVTALRGPQQHPHSEPACSFLQDDVNSQPSEDNSPVSDLSDSPKFQMKNQFDAVLKELNLYFDISMSDFASNNKESSQEQWKATEDEVPGCSSPDLRHHDDASSGK